MRHFKHFAWLALALGMALPGASAADYYGARRNSYSGPFDNQQGFRQDTRDWRQDYVRTNRLRSEASQDRQRFNENRCGQGRAAGQDARYLSRDERTIDGFDRDFRYDQSNIYGNSQYRREYSEASRRR